MQWPTPKSTDVTYVWLSTWRTTNCSITWLWITSRTTWIFVCGVVRVLNLNRATTTTVTLSTALGDTSVKFVASNTPVRVDCLSIYAATLVNGRINVQFVGGATNTRKICVITWLLRNVCLWTSCCDVSLLFTEMSFTGTVHINTRWKVLFAVSWNPLFYWWLRMRRSNEK